MTEPLAMRMRPDTLDEIVGQRDILDQNGLLYKMIKSDRLSSIILYGPPGTGKTTVANVIAKMTSSDFNQINAVAAGKKDIELVCSKASSSPGVNTILFIDEIHRFNKSQQDYLLPFVERGVVTLIGATTENPYFEVNPALVSRSVIFRLNPISANDIKELIARAMTDCDKGIGKLSLMIEPSAADLIAEQANGDARHALSILELASVIADNGTITSDNVKEVIQKPHLDYDKDGDKHYDSISAFIKSMRGSDPDATLYYLARMLESGENPKYIARRIVCQASEEVGNADPNALNVAVSAFLATERIGLPECRLALAQAALYVAMAPKSNAVIMGIDGALEYIREHPSNNIPPAMRDDHYKSAYKLGHGIGYLYPHDYPNHWCEQRYLPDGVNETFYHSCGIGHERNQDNYQNFVKNRKDGQS